MRLRKLMVIIEGILILGHFTVIFLVMKKAHTHTHAHTHLCTHTYIQYYNIAIYGMYAHFLDFGVYLCL